jgi:hypothetical protein
MSLRALILILSCAAAPSAYAQYAPLPPLTREVTVAERKFPIRIEPKLRLLPEDGALKLELIADADLSEGQGVLKAIAEGRKKDDECGDTIDVHSVSVYPSGNVVRVDGKVHVDRWVCTYMDVPKINGLTVRMERVRTLKTRVFEQTVDLCIELAPQLQAKSIALDVRVVCAAPSGALGEVVRALGLADLLKREIEKAIQQEVARQQLSFLFPPEFEQYGVQIREVKFVDRGGRALGASASGSARLTQADFADLLGRYMKPR